MIKSEINLVSVVPAIITSFFSHYLRGMQKILLTPTRLIYKVFSLETIIENEIFAVLAGNNKMD